MNSLGGGGAERVGLTLLNEFKEKGLSVLLICIDREKKYPEPEDVEVIYLTKYEKITNPLVKVLWVLIGALRLKRVIREKDISLVQSHITRANFANTGAKILGSRHYAQIVTHLPITFDHDNPIVRPF